MNQRQDMLIPERTKGERGISLIEIIVTLVVLSIAAVGVLSVFSTGMRGSADPVLTSQAVKLAQEKMDEAVALRKSGGFASVVSLPASALPAPYDAFSWSRSVVCVTAADVNTSTGAPPCGGGYARVTIAVTHAAIAAVNLDTVITDY